MVRSFVGRLFELATLRGMIDRAHTDGPTVALVLGVAGSGKTRLLAETVSAMDNRSLVRLVGYEPERNVPLAAAREMLNRLIRVPGEGTRLESLAFGTGEARQPLELLRVFEVAHRCLTTMKAVTACVDDLQWVDDASAALLHYLLRAADSNGDKVAMLVASRPGRAVTTFGLAVRQLIGDERVTEMELGGVTREDGIALARAISPALNHAGAASIWESAAGSPFWIEALAVGAGHPGQAVDMRLQHLGADAATLLGLLAVAARPLEIDDVASALAWRAARLQSASVELENRGIAALHASNIELTHDLIREGAVEKMPDEQRRRIHRLLASHLAARAGDDAHLLGRALDHARQAGMPLIDLALRLARSPRRRLIGNDGVRGLARVVDETDAAAADDRQELAIEVARLATDLGDQGLALERWALIAESRAEAPVRAAAALAASKAAFELGQRDEASRLLAIARSTGAVDDALEIALDAQESTILRWLDHRIGDARGLTERALRRARELAHSAGRIDALPPPVRAAYFDAVLAAYHVAMQDDDADAMLELAEELRAVAGDERHRLEADLLASHVLRWLSRLTEAEARARTVLRIASERVYPDLAVDAGHHLGATLRPMGRLDEARVVVDEALELSRRAVETSRYLSSLRRVRSEIGLSLGPWQAAVGALREEAKAEPDPHFRLGVDQTIALWLSRVNGANAADEVLERFARAETDAATAGCARCIDELRLRAAEGFARIGHEQLAVRALAQWRERHQAENPYVLMLVTRIDGLLAASAERLADAERMALETDYRLEALWCSLDLGRMLASVDAEAAAAAFRHAQRLAEESSAATERALAERGLHALGKRIRRPSAPTRRWGLSEREEEVAQLVGTGASNPEIAAALFLSRKTVERHVSNVLAKAGARNRAELASLLAQIGPQTPSE